jgi:hypothetical protein
VGSNNASQPLRLVTNAEVTLLDVQTSNVFIKGAVTTAVVGEKW